MDQDTLRQGLLLMAMGMGVVFAALLLLQLAINLLGLVERRHGASPAEPDLPAGDPAPVPGEVVAAISAAVTVALGRPVRIHSVRRVPRKPAWSLAGRADIAESHHLRRARAPRRTSA